MNFDQLGHVTQIGDERNLYAIGAKGEANRIGGVVWNSEGVHFNVANREALASVNGLNTAEAFAKRFGKAPLQRVHGGFRNVKRRFPEPEHLGQAAAMVIVFV